MAPTSRSKFFSWSSKNARHQSTQETYYRTGGLLEIETNTEDKSQFVQCVELDHAKVRNLSHRRCAVNALGRVVSLVYRRRRVLQGLDVHPAFACGRLSLACIPTDICTGYNMASKSKETLHRTAKLYLQPEPRLSAAEPCPGQISTEPTRRLR